MEYCKQKNKKKKKKKVRVFFALLLVFFVLCFIYLELVINPVVVAATKQSVCSLSSTAVSDAVYDVLKEENISYEDLVSISYTTSGDVSLINYQSVKMNLIARKIYSVAQKKLDQLGQNGVNVPLGAFTGLPFLAGVGPKISVKMMPIGVMSISFDNLFTSVGVNQTNHSIYVKLSASVSLVLPAYKASVDSETNVLISQCVIVGKIPDTYLGKNEQIDFAIN